MSLLSETTPTITLLFLLLPLTFLTFLTFLLRVLARYLRLRHVPGPWLPALTDAPLQWRLRAGANYVDVVYALHETHGPVVRWGPNRVSLASTAAIPLVYGNKSSSNKLFFPKAPSYRPMVVLAPGSGQEVISLITVRDEARMSTIKSQIAAGFSQSAWLKQEGQIDETLAFLVQRLHEQTIQPPPLPPLAGPEKKAAAAVVVPLDKWLSLWGFDTLAQLAFSDSRGFLAHGRDVDGVFAGSASRFAHWKHWLLLPTLEWWLHKSAPAQRLRPWFGNKNPASALVRLATARIEERKRELMSSGVTDKSIVNNAAAAGDSSARDLVGRFLAASAQNPQAIDGSDVLGLTISTIHAGADTTSSASAHVLANALSQPETWSMLEEEILGAGLACPPSFKDVASLPVLDAVIRESLRLSFASGITSERRTTHDTILCGVRIPCGTDVSVSPHDASRDTTVFGPDADVFRPQRWMEADEQHWQVMEKASFAFLHGKRMCIGRHLAWIKMKKVVATLILSFKISLAQQPVSSWRSGLVRMVDLNVYLEPRA